jgi:hypothetical protein
LRLSRDELTIDVQNLHSERALCQRITNSECTTNAPRKNFSRARQGVTFFTDGCDALLLT